MLLMAAFYFLMDVRSWKKWGFALCVIGMNSIAAYCIAHLFDGFIAENFATHFGKNIFLIFGETYQSLIRGSLVRLAMWSILFGMYRRKLFLRV